MPELVMRDSPEALAEWVDQIADEFELAWIEGVVPRITEYLRGADGARRAALLPVLVRLDLEYRAQAGQERTLADYEREYPDLGRFSASASRSQRNWRKHTVLALVIVVLGGGPLSLLLRHQPTGDVQLDETAMVHEPESLLAVATGTFERAVAEWVLSSGGWLSLRKGAKIVDVRAAKDLPSSSFQVLKVQFPPSALMVDDDLRHLVPLANLTELRLYNAHVGDDGLAHLRSLTKLSELELSGTHVTDAGLANLKGLTGLERLELQSTRVANAGLVHLQALPSLKRLGLGATRVTDAGLTHLESMTRLRALTLSGTRVSSVGLVYLRGLTDLSWLSLDNTLVDDGGLAHLAPIVNLAELHLLGTRVTDKGMKFLNTHLALRSLELQHTDVSDAALVDLEALPNLRRLGLASTKISDRGLIHLRSLLNLEHLDLRETRVSDAGLPDLVSLPPSVKLDLTNARLSAKGFASLRAALPSAEVIWSEPNRTAAIAVLAIGGIVSVSTGAASPEILIKRTEDLPAPYFRLTRVRLGGIRRPMPGLFNKLAALSDPEFDHLETLDLSASTIGDADLVPLRRLTRLRELDIRGTKVTSLGLSALRTALPGCRILTP
jgi:Leucine-rich repeat (LRR) protein